MDPLSTDKLTKIPKNLPIKVRNPRIPKFFAIFTVITLIALSFVFKNQLFELANRSGLFPALRRIGVIRSSAPDFFNALQNQNLSYDFDGNGVVSGEDYLELLKQTDSDLPKQVVSNLTAATGVTEAVSDTLALPSVRAFGNDAFNGATTVSYPIDLPTGTAGLSPSLSISYSSASVDDLYLGKKTLWRNDVDSPYQKQAGIVGLGWNLGGIQSISRDTNGTLNAPGDDKFILSFTGGSANLSKESGDEYYSVWRTIPNLMVKVERYGRCKNNDSLALCRNHWEVTTGNGTKYIFGSSSTVDSWHTEADPETSTFAQGSGNDWYRLYEGTVSNPKGSRSWLIFGSDGPGYHGLTYNWYLDTVRSVYDKSGGPDVEINYTYDIEFNTYKGQSYVSAVYPSTIKYGRHEVNILRENRLDYQTHDEGQENPRQPFRSKQRVNKIVVKTDGKVQSAYKLNYVYGYNSSKHSESSVVSGQVIHSLLNKITVYSDDPDTNSGAKRLPAYTFGYGSNCDSFKNGCPLTAFVSDDTNTQERTPNDYFLKTAENGYGGKVTFEYWGGNSDNTINVKYCKDNKDSGCRTGHMNNTGRHRISAKVVDDGMGDTIRTTYNYTGSGATLGLAFVEGYGDEWYVGKNCCKVEGGQCTGKPAGCRCPSSSTKCFTQISGGWDCVGGTSCSYSSIASSCCPSDLPISKAVKCTNPANDNRYYCIIDNNTSCQSNCKYRSDPFAGYEFLGYPEVEAIVYEKNSSSSVAAKSKTFFHQVIENDTCFKPSPLKGMAYKTQSFDAGNSSRWQESESKYVVRFGEMFGSHDQLSNGEMGSYCDTYNPETTTTLVLNTESIAKSIMPSPQLCTKTVTTYDTGPYALPQAVSNWGKISCSNTAQDNTSDRRHTSYTQYTEPNTTKWILPLPKETWTSDSDNGIKYGHTKLIYDNASHGVIGNYGNITESQTFVNGTKYATSRVSYSTSYPWLATSSTDANGITITTSYETRFNMYPTKTTNTLGQSISTLYDFNVNDSSHPNNGGVLGVPVKVTDANGQTTTIVYDDFGRPLDTYLPGRKPGSNKPNSSSRYYYYNESTMSPCNASTNCLTGLGKELSGKGPKMMVYQSSLLDDTGTIGKLSASHTYYNGTGQNIQTRQLWYEGEIANAGIPIEGEGNKDILVSQVYNVLGQVSHQSLSYTADPHKSLTSSAFDTRNIVSDGSIKTVSNTYDGFGRSVAINNPDGTKQTTSFDVGGNPLKTSFSNANCHDGNNGTPCATTTTTTDAFGQTFLVEENTGSKTLKTSFEYHPVLGSVTKTIDTNGNAVSNIQYDVLGRKTKMWDIDMSPFDSSMASTAPNTEEGSVLAESHVLAKGAHDITESWHGCVLRGWACDGSNYSIPLSVHFYDGSNFVGGVLADDGAEQGVADGCGGNYNHRFTYNLPASYQDGTSHTFTAYAIGINSSGGVDNANPKLSNTPRTVTCERTTTTPTPIPTNPPLPTIHENPPPNGAHDPTESWHGCVVRGWACDGSNYSNPINVHIYEGTNFIGGILADDGAEQGVADGCGGNANHRFTYNLPNSFRDGSRHDLTVYGIGVDSSGNPDNVNPELEGTPQAVFCDNAPITSTPINTPIPTTTYVPPPLPTDSIPSGKAWEYEYDKVGNLIKQTNPKGQVTTLDYDNLYRLKSKNVNGTTLLNSNYDNCTNGTGKICEEISYDPTSSREVEKVRYEYTKYGLISKLNKTISNLPDSKVNGTTFTTSLSYDEGGRVLSTNHSYPTGLSLSGETVNYTYERPYLTKIAGSNTYALDAKYDKSGAMIKFSSGNGVVNSYSYNDNNLRLKSLSVQGQNLATEDNLQLSYDYDSIGNITKITDNNPAHASTNFNSNQSFGYDSLSRLTNVTGTYSADFTYDDIGNILTKNEGGIQVNLGYSSNSGGFYHRPQTAKVQGSNSNFQYDAIGNMTSDGSRIYEYDSDNRLSKTGDASFYYNAGGQRIAKIISGGLNTYYISPELEIIISPNGDTSWRKNYFFAGKLAAVREGGDPIVSPTPGSSITPTMTIPPTPAGVPGDADGNEIVDTKDYSIWATFYNSSTQQGASSGDFDSDGSVDGKDYMIWLINYSP